MTFGVSAVAASIAEFSSSILRNPFEVIKQNMQMLSYGKISESMKNIYEIRGLRGFYAGFMPLILREVPFSTIQLPVFEFFQKLLKGRGTY